MIYGTRVSNNHQEIRRIQRVLKVPEIDEEKMMLKIARIETTIQKEKKIYLVVLGLSFLVHLLLLFVQTNFEGIEIVYAALLAMTFFLFYGIVNWLKGREMLSVLPNSDSSIFDRWY